MRLHGWGGLRGVNASVLTAADPNAENTLDDPERVAPRETAATWERHGSTLILPLPPFSVAVATLRLAPRRRLITGREQLLPEGEARRGP